MGGVTETTSSLVQAVLLTGFLVHTVSTHPQCENSEPPFTTTVTESTFCPSYAELGCCGEDEDKLRRVRYHAIKTNAPDDLWQRCSSYVETFLCLSCSPYAAHTFASEGGDAPRIFPGLCGNYCREFYSSCKDIVQYYMPPGEKETARLLTSVESGSDVFCNTVAIPDAAYCHPKVHTQGPETLPTAEGGGDDCLCVEEVVDKLRSPLFARPAHDGSKRMFVGEQMGEINIFHPNGKREPEPFLNLTKKMFPQVLRNGADERGLLGLAFHPKFETNQKLYVVYTARTASENMDHTTRVSEFRVSGTNRNRVDMSSERIILEVDQPFANHNGGEIFFRPGDQRDYLYVPLGDGGSGGETGINGQNLHSMLGKVLRLDVDSTTPPYGIPPTNPFADGVDGLPEIYAYGLRNPWRCGVDRGDLGTGHGKGRVLCGDVGQWRWEKVVLLTLNANYGWNGLEGNVCFNEETCPVVAKAKNYVAPVHVYPHTVGRCVIGGAFYRGCRSQNLRGSYIYGDYMDGKLFRLSENEATGKWDNKEVLMCGDDLCSGNLQNKYHKNILAFDEDEDGEVYMMSTRGPRPNDYRAALYRIVDPTSRDDEATC